MATSVELSQSRVKQFFNFEEIVVKTWDESIVGIVVASDGIWEMMENDFVARTLGKFLQGFKCEEALNELLKRAMIRWKTVREVVYDNLERDLYG